MYKSPIELLVTEIQHQIVKQQDEEIYKAVLNYVPNVDKEELIRALQYDRDQYEKGYSDGKRDAMDELVRCKDCKNCKKYRNRFDPTQKERMLCKRIYDFAYGVEADDFCSYGERRINDVR